MNFKMLGTSGMIASMALLAACATTEEEEIIVVEEEVVEDTMSALEKLEMALEETGQRVFFGYDASNLDADAQATLRRQAALLEANPGVRIQVFGNCDERGTREYNLALGARRAEAAKEFLMDLGISGDRIDTISNGKESPLDPRSTPEAWAKNRNATTVIIASTVDMLDMM